MRKSFTPFQILGLSLGLCFVGCNCPQKGSLHEVSPKLVLRQYEDGKAPQDGVLIEEATADIDFGTRNVGKPFFKFLALTNEGTGALHLDGDPTLKNGIDFKLVEVLKPCRGHSAWGDSHQVPLGECSSVGIQFIPTAIAVAEDFLTLRSDDSSRPEIVMHLVGVGDTGTIEVCVLQGQAGPATESCSTTTVTTLAMDFGSVPLGGGDKRRTLRISNHGRLPLTVSSLGPQPGDPIDYSIVPPWTGSIDPAGDPVEVQVAFRPAQAGARQATIEINSDDVVTNPVYVKVTGVGDGPKISFDSCANSTQKLDFGSVTVGTNSTKNVQILNCGTRALSLTGLALEGSASFVLTNTVPGGALIPGGSVTATIKYSPSAYGAEIGRMRVSSTDPATPVAFVELDGTGAPPPQCILESSPASLDFGAVAMSGTATKTVTLHNAGLLDCTLQSFTLDAAGVAAKFIIKNSPSPGTLLAPNGLADLTMEYQPMDGTGPDQGVLTVASNDPSQPSGLKVPLQGSPTPAPSCQLSINPPVPSTGLRTLMFGTVGLGSTKLLPVTLTNSGSAPCQLGWPTFGAGSDMGAFNVSSTTPTLPTTLAPGQTETVVTLFRPPTYGSWAAATNFLTMTSNDGSPSAPSPSECGAGTAAGCKKIGLSGTGADISLSVVPGSLDFGVVTVGCSSTPMRTVTLYNVGAGSITINGIYIDPSSAPFSITPPLPLPLTLAPGTNAAVQLKYKAPSVGTQIGLLTILHNQGGGVSTVPLKGTGTTDTHQVDTFQQLANPKTDILFAVDNSCSMADKQSYLSSNAQTFINAALSTNNDFHLGVTTTDWNHPGNYRTTYPYHSDASSAYPSTGVIQIGGLYPSLPPNPKWIERTTPNASTLFSNYIRVGQFGSDDSESGMSGALAALSSPMITDPTQNMGFLRQDAKLAIVVLSDEEDGGSPPPLGLTLPTTQFYADSFWALKGAPGNKQVVVHVIVGDSPGGCCNGTRDPVFGSCSGVSADAGNRYIDVANRTGGIFRSICSNDWGRIAQDIGLDAFSAQATFALTRTANPSTIVVTVNGATKVQGSDYTYDSAKNAVTFAAGKAPPANATIVVSYDTICL